MSEIDSSDDLIESELTRLSAGTARAEFRQRLFADTSRVVKRHRQLRRVRNLAALAACYVAGVATMFFVRPSTPPQQAIALPDAETKQDAQAKQDSAPPRDAGAAHQPPAKPSRQPTAKPRDMPVKRPAAPLPAKTLERMSSLAAAGQRPKMLTQAANRYLEESGDYESAIRCFALAVKNQPAAQLSAIDPDEHWLLLALKQAKQQEASDGR